MEGRYSVGETFHGSPELMPSTRLQLNDKSLAVFTESGIAVHHAGLETQDRRLVEEAYKSGVLKMIVCTSVRISCWTVRDTD